MDGSIPLFTAHIKMYYKNHESMMRASKWLESGIRNDELLIRICYNDNIQQPANRQPNQNLQ